MSAGIQQRDVLFGAWCFGLLALSALGCGDSSTPASMAEPTASTPSTGSATPSAGTMASTAGAPSAGNSATAGTSATSSSPSTAAATAGSRASAGQSGTAAGAGGSAANTGAAAGGGAAGGEAESGTSGSSGAAGASGAAGTSGATAGSAAATGGTGAAGSDAAAGSGGSATAPHEDLGEGDGRDVVLIGDSWMSNTLQIEGTGGGISSSLQRLSGKPYRNYAVQGVMLLSADAFGPAIPTQWDQAKRADPDIKTVIMTGAGNDVIQNPGLQEDCMNNGEQCKEFRAKVFDALDKLWSRMAEDGVKDIIYVAYAASAGNNMPSNMPASMPVPACMTGKVRCHSQPTTDLVMDDLAADGIHPVRAANDRVAMALLQKMKTEGMRR